MLVPCSLGAVAGSIASGRVRAHDASGIPATAELWTSWINPTSTLGGLLAVAVCAYLAAVYLAWDSHRLGQPEMVGYFRRRALAAGAVTGGPAFAGLFVPMGAVATVIRGWGIAQWPWLLHGSLTVSEGAAPEGRLVSVLVVFALAAVIILPSLGFLYVLHQRSLLGGDEGNS